MFDFIAGLYSFISGSLILVLLVIGVFIGLALLSLIGAKLQTSRRKSGSTNGFFQVHQSTGFTVKDSIGCRKARGQLTAGLVKELVDGKEDVLCATEKPIAVIEFEGDPRASGRKSFSRLVDEIIVNKGNLGGCVVVVASPGGGVAEYGQLFAEMQRMRDSGITITVCVDTYAASGGYLMALPAHKIVAAPFSILGSIGVVAEFLNFHGLLTRYGVTPLTFTAGERKRTVTQFSEVTEEGRQAYLAQLKAIHDQFKDLVAKYRPKITNVESICNGEVWTAQRAFDENLGLVDEIGTSRGYLLRLNLEHKLVYLAEKDNAFEVSLRKLLTGGLDHVIQRIEEKLVTKI